MKLERPRITSDGIYTLGMSGVAVASGMIGDSLIQQVDHAGVFDYARSYALFTGSMTLALVKVWQQSKEAETVDNRGNL